MNSQDKDRPLGMNPALGSPSFKPVGDMCFQYVETTVGILDIKEHRSGFKYRFVFHWSQVERDPLFLRNLSATPCPKCLIFASRRVT